MAVVRQPTNQQGPPGAAWIGDYYDPATQTAYSLWETEPSAAGTPETVAAPPPAPAAAPAPTPGPTQQQQDAFAIVRGLLDQYGLGSLSDWAWNLILTGASPVQVEVELRQRPEYRARFPGIAEREKAGLPPISAAEYVAYENSAVSLFRSAGLPSGFYDEPSDIGRFIGRNVSLAELSARVQEGLVAAQQAPREVRDELSRLFGVGEGTLAAFFLDPDKALPAIRRQFAASQIGGASRRAGFGLLAGGEAERLAELGVSEAQAQEGFGQLAGAQELFRPLPGQEGAEGIIGREQQLGAAFGGDTAAQEAIRRRGRRRRAEFEGGGSFAAGQRGVIGLGEAGT